MPVYFDRFEPDRVGLNAFMHSSELDDAVKEAADDVIHYARGNSSKLDAAGWQNVRGPNVRIRKYTRLSRRVENNDRAAASIEFGSGKSAEGRPQGGKSGPKRILGRAGARVGDYKGGMENAE